MSSMRASDADREKVADRLRQAAGEGRIFAHELEERVAAALRAKTYGELDAVVADLPGPALTARPRSRTRELALHHPALAVAALVAVAIVGTVLAAIAFVASGAWVLFMVMLLILRGGPRRRKRYSHRYRSAGGQVHVRVHRQMR
jgi:hypothetical protein